MSASVRPARPIRFAMARMTTVQAPRRAGYGRGNLAREAKTKAFRLIRLALRRRERIVGVALFHRLSDDSVGKGGYPTKHRHDWPQQKGWRHKPTQQRSDRAKCDLCNWLDDDEHGTRQSRAAGQQVVSESNVRYEVR